MFNPKDRKGFAVYISAKGQLCSRFFEERSGHPDAVQTAVIPKTGKRRFFVICSEYDIISVKEKRREDGP